MGNFKILAGVAAFAIIASGAHAQQSLESAIDQDYSYLHDLYEHLHQNPELSFQEEQTAARMAAELRMLGFEVSENIGGHGIVGVMANGDGPTVMLRTDLDALPVKEQTGVPYASTATGIEQTGQEVSVMHACGHDVHMTVFVGTARRLAALKDQWSGTLVMIGQPAEERGAGAKAMLEDGLFERFPKPDYNMALHVSASMPAGKIAYVPGYALANVDSVDITVHGIGGHGAYPHTTKDPVMLASQIIMGLQTIVSREISPQEPAVVTVGSIHGGAKHNVISDRVELQLTVRSYADAVRDKILAAIERISVNTARAAGFPENRLPEVTVKDEYTPSTYNDPDLTHRIASVLKAELGGDRVVETDPVMGGEDFSRYGRTDDRIPSLIMWLGGVAPETYQSAMAGEGDLPSLHSPFFAPLPEPTITTGVEAMTTAALELLAESGS